MPQIENMMNIWIYHLFNCGHNASLTVITIYTIYSTGIPNMNFSLFLITQIWVGEEGKSYEKLYQ